MLGFDHKTALKQLIRKSGYTKEITEDLLKRLKVTRFQSKKASVDVTKYIHIRNTKNI